MTASPDREPSQLAPRLAAELDGLAELWPAVMQARIPGAARPHPPAELSPEAREDRDWLARMERHERADIAPGEAPVPIDLDVLELLTDVLADADVLAGELSRSAGLVELSPPSSGLADPRPYLRQAAAALRYGVQDQGLLPWAASVVRQLAVRAARALGGAEDGQLVPVVCPWCQGLSPQAPTGGGYTWRVYVLPGGAIAIVCEGLCEPPLRDVGTWWRGKPCWPMSQWSWLARRVHAAEARRNRRAS